MAAKLDPDALDLDGTDATAAAPEAGATEAAATPPKRGRGRPPKAKPAGGDTAPRREETGARGPGRPSNAQKLEKSLTDQFGSVAMLAMAIDPRVGLILMEDAPAHAAALTKLAEQNPKVRKMLEGGLTGSAWFGVLFAFGSTGFRIVQATKPAPAAPAADASPAPPAAPLRIFGTGTDGR